MRVARRSSPLAAALLASACTSGTTVPPAAAPAAAPEPDVTLVYAGAAQGSGLVAETLEVPLDLAHPADPARPHDPMDGIEARRVFTRAAAARGARYVSDLEFHFAVDDTLADGPSNFECVVRMQTLPAGAAPAAAPPDPITRRLVRDTLVRFGPPVRSRCTNTPTPAVTATDLANGAKASAPLAVTPGSTHCDPAEQPVANLPYWAAYAWFLPVFYDKAHPPATGKWQLFVSEPHCVAVATLPPPGVVRGTIYLVPSTTRSVPPPADAPPEPAPEPAAPR